MRNFYNVKFFDIKYNLGNNFFDSNIHNIACMKVKEKFNLRKSTLLKGILSNPVKWDLDN